MNDVPNDLIPLPTQPWAVRPTSIPLDREEVRTALWMADGNVSEAATILKTSSLRLRNFIRNSEYLTKELQEFKERLADKAEVVVAEALSDPDRCDPMARFILNSIAKERGWGTAGKGGVNVNMNGGSVLISWADGSTFASADEPPMKDITPQEAAE